MTPAIQALVVCAGIVASGCGGDDRAAAPVRTSSCSDVYYEGDGDPDAIIVSELALGRPSDALKTNTLMVDAIKLVLRQRDFRAGERRIGYESCSYVVGGEPDGLLCEHHAKAYAAAKDVLGVIGPFHSGCTEIQLPILALRTAGPLAMVSPTNTYVGLTRTGPGANAGHPRALYPDGVRNYVRVVAPDGVQGAALARYAEASGLRRAVTLYDHGDPYAVPISAEFLRAARELGLEAEELDWPDRKTYAALARRAARLRPDLVYLIGPGFGQQRYVKQLVEALRATVGPRVVIAGSDGFVVPDAVEHLGTMGEGLLVTAVGTANEYLPPAGRAFLRELGKEGIAAPGFFGAPEAAQAAEVLLDAIARSDGTRASVVEELFETQVKDGILGSFRFDRNGDIAPLTVTVYRIEGGKVVPERLVKLPLGEGS